MSEVRGSMNLEQAKQRVAVLEDLLREARAAVAALESQLMKAEEDAAPWFEPSYGDCPTCGLALKLIPPGTNRHGSTYDAFVGCKGYPSCRYARPLSASERDARDGKREEHHETHLAVDHRSTNAANAFDMKEAILFEVGNVTSITKTNLWMKMTNKGKGGQGYNVFKAMLEEMHTEGKIVLAREKGYGGQAEIWRISPVAVSVY